MRRTALALTAILLTTTAQAQPRSDQWYRDQQQLLTKLANPPLTVIKYDIGGVLHEYHKQWTTVAALGGQVRILGQCNSACTLVTGYVSRDKICFGPDARMSFHMPQLADADGTPSPRHARWMFGKYPADIQAWMERKGGPEKMSVHNYWTLMAPDLWAMGYRRCND